MPVAVRFVSPTLVIDPEVVTVWHSMFTLPPALIVPEELLVKVPELHVACKLEIPLSAALIAMLFPEEVSVNELEELVDATALDTVIAPVELGMVTDPALRAATKSATRIFVEVAAEASKTPLAKNPPVVTPVFMVTDVAIKDGAWEKLVPTKPSEEKVRFCVDVTPL